MKNFSTSQGITLIEVIVTSALFGLIMVAIISFFIFSTSTVQKNAQNADVSQNARLGMDRIVSEIRYGSRVHAVGGDTHLEIEDMTHQDSSDFKEDPPVYHPKYVNYELKDLGSGKKVVERYEQVCYDGSGQVDKENNWERKDILWACSDLRELVRYDAVELVESISFQCLSNTRCTIDLALKKGSTPVRVKSEVSLKNERPL